MFSTKNIISYIIFIIVATGFYIVSKHAEEKYTSIQSFKECVDAGYPVLETYPETCMTPDRRNFTNPNQKAATTTPVLPLVATSTSKDFITVDSLVPNMMIKSPIIIKGKARGFWFFEGTFPVQILDSKNKTIWEGSFHSKGNWMTEDFVQFDETITFSQPTTATGTIVFRRNNPTKDPKNDDSLVIPVRFAQAERTINVYLYNRALDKDKAGNILCGEKGLVPVERVIPLTKSPVQDSINTLLDGDITKEEKDRGLSTEYPLKGVTIAAILSPKGELVLNVNDQFNETTGGACKISILKAQLLATAKQFDEVTTVTIQPPTVFQP